MTSYYRTDDGRTIPLAECPKCGRGMFAVGEHSIICIQCSAVYPFEFLDDAKLLCTTKADELVRLVEGNR